MNIIVCIKQVPNTAEVKINPETGTLMREGVPSIVNPFDTFAVEEALCLKEKFGGKVTVLTMGPQQAVEALKEALAMGADEAILLSDRAFAGSDTWATAYTLALAIRKLGAFDIILCGKQAIDGDTAQVGPEMATLLDIPYATFVKKIEMLDERHLKVTRQTDEGMEIWKLPMPSLVTVIKELGEPRLPSLRHKMRAKKAEIPVWGVSDLGLDPSAVGLAGSYTQVVRVFSPPRRGDRIVLQGTIEEQVDQLYHYLKEAKVPGI